MASEAERTQRAFARMALSTLVVTIALVGFTLWISDGVLLGRVIAAGVMALGFLQWVAIRRLAHQIAARDRQGVEPDGATR